jgi:protein phosphatase
MTLEFASALDVGRARTNNEDSVALDADAKVAVLADGMGGYNAGEVASAMATSIVCSSLVQWLSTHSVHTPRELAYAMSQCVGQANRAIFDASNGNPQYSGMGTTLVMVAVTGGHLVVGHVGDSRAYRLRDGQLQRLTRDHSCCRSNWTPASSRLRRPPAPPIATWSPALWAWRQRWHWRRVTTA